MKVPVYDVCSYVEYEGRCNDVDAYHDFNEAVERINLLIRSDDSYYINWASKRRAEQNEDEAVEFERHLHVLQHKDSYSDNSKVVMFFKNETGSAYTIERVDIK